MTSEQLKQLLLISPSLSLPLSPSLSPPPPLSLSLSLSLSPSLARRKVGHFRDFSLFWW